MLTTIDLQNVLEKQRNKHLTEENILDHFKNIYKDVDKERAKTASKLSTKASDIKNIFDINKIDSNAIFHIDDIKKTCIDYRLRFLDTQFFKDEFPAEAISQIHKLEKKHKTSLNGFKIVAPMEVFTLKKADDPLLFVPMGNNYYYLIYKWGNDIHPLRKMKYWSFKNIENLLISMTIVSVFFTALTYPFFITREPNFGYLLMLFMFYFKGVVGMFFIFFGSSGKNFSEYSWQSQYDKIR